MGFSAASATPRFPHPEFESGYQVPESVHPPPVSYLLEYLDAGLLFGALALASYLAIRRRSRTGLFALMVVSLAYFGFWKKGCVCAVGSLQNVALAFGDAGYRPPFHVVLFFLLPLVFTLFFGRTFCAAVCPLGAIQDVVVLRPLRVPEWLSRSLGLLPYVYLGLAVLFAVTGSGFVICRYDPFVSFFRLSGSTTMVVLGAALLLLGVVVARPYCRFLCPYGVLLSWMSRFSKWRISITPGECVECRLCEESCPFGAIHPPSPERAPEPREEGVRRLGILLLLLPLIVAAAGWVGTRLSEPLSFVNPTVSLAEQVRREDAGLTEETTKASDFFRESGESLPELQAQAFEIREGFRLGGLLFGAFIGLSIGGTLIGLSVRRRRDRFEQDRAHCFSCGRCFLDCPNEHLRLDSMGESEARPPAALHTER